MIPVLARPERAPAVANSLREVSDARLLFICSPKDDAQIAACFATGEEVKIVPWGPERGDYAKKINLAFTETNEPWLFCGADDLRFGDQWDVFALRVGEMTGAGVVGTQDLGNPLVKRGKTSTHPLVRREYIATQSGTFDGSGQIYSEEYDHQYIDLELAEVAKARGQWAFSKRSVVEHLHPNWGKAERDATYEKAFREVAKDRALFQRRMEQFRRLQRSNRSHSTL